MVTPAPPAADAVTAAVAAVPDPELPQVGIGDLGILRGVTDGPGGVTVTITPTYSGCPALETIRADITAALEAIGVTGAVVRTVLDPPWSTDAITDAGRAKLAAAGIAPPGPAATGGAVPVHLSVRCPRCGSPGTREIAHFSGTACKALYSCLSCGEPFEHVKAF